MRTATFSLSLTVRMNTMGKQGWISRDLMCMGSHRHRPSGGHLGTLMSRVSRLPLFQCRGSMSTENGGSLNHLHSLLQAPEYSDMCWEAERRGRRERILGSCSLTKFSFHRLSAGSALILESFLQQNSPVVKVQIFLHCPNTNAQ